LYRKTGALATGMAVDRPDVSSNNLVQN